MTNSHTKSTVRRRSRRGATIKRSEIKQHVIRLEFTERGVTAQRDVRFSRPCNFYTFFFFQNPCFHRLGIECSCDTRRQTSLSDKPVCLRKLGPVSLAKDVKTLTRDANAGRVAIAGSRLRARSNLSPIAPFECVSDRLLSQRTLCLRDLEHEVAFSNRTVMLREREGASRRLPSL